MPLEAVTHALVAANPGAHTHLLSYLIGRTPNIFVEKPAGLDPAMVLELHRRSLLEGSSIQVGFNFRFCAGAHYLRHHTPVKPLAVQATFLSKHPVATGLSYPAVIPDWLKTNGLHLIDLLAHLWGRIVITGVRSRSVVDERFLLQVDAEIEGSPASLLLGNWATKFTMQVTAITAEGTVVRMLDPCHSDRIPELSQPNAGPRRNESDRLVDLGYMAELEILLGTHVAERQRAATLLDGVRALEIIEQIRLMVNDE